MILRPVHVHEEVRAPKPNKFLCNQHKYGIHIMNGDKHVLQGPSPKLFSAFCPTPKVDRVTAQKRPTSVTSVSPEKYGAHFFRRSFVPNKRARENNFCTLIEGLLRTPFCVAIEIAFEPLNC